MTQAEIADPMDARAHFEGAKSEALMDAEVDWLLEEGIAGENASVEEGEGPHVKLPEPGVSRLSTPEEAVPHLAITTATIHHFRGF